MTAPIQEPNLYRHASGLQWGQNQLFRRPAPPASDDRPWCRVSKPFPDGTFYPNQTIANNSNITIDFDEVYNLDVGDSGDGFFTTQGSPVNTIRIAVQGLYAITAEVYWLEASTFPWYMAFSGDGLSWAHRTHFGYWDTFGAEDAMGSTSFIHRYEANSNSDIELHVYQRSGGNRTINAAYLEVSYLGSYTGIDFDDILPFQ
jgi:hypothetical protein